MFNKSLFTSLVAAISSLGVNLSIGDRFFKAPKKPAKRYPSMVIDYADMAEWNRKVAAGKISRKGHRHA